MAIDLSGIASWLHGWFPFHSEVVAKDQTSANASKNLVTDTSGEVTLENKVSVGTGLSFDNNITNKINHSNSITAQTSAVAKKIKYDGQGHITDTSALYGSDIAVSSSDSTKIDSALSNKANSTHTHTISNITDFNMHTHYATDVYDYNSENYTNLGNLGEDALQSAINSAINTAIGNLQSIKAIEVTSDKGTASSDKLGKLFIVNENSKVNVYYIKQTGTGSSATYSWEKMDTDILDEYVVYWSNVQNRPTKTSDFTNDGADGTNVFVSNNDSRLSDARTPTSHQHGSITNDGKIGNASGSVITTGSGGVLQASTSLSATKIDISDMGLTTLDYPYPITNLEDYIADRDMKIQSITIPNVPSEIATILTHIDTYYNYYQ